jgi:predicted TIM-barrel fold metal-dependent hydrolase
MIIDAHIHVWELDSEPYPWQPLAGIAPDYAWPVEKEIEVMASYGIDKAIIVQPSMYAFDNRYILDCSQRYPDRFRLIGLVDPRSDRVESAMESLASQGFRGLRLSPRLRPDIAWYNDRQADRLWQKASQLNMILTLLIGLDQLASVAEAIKRFPNVQVVIDHLARPDATEDPGGKLFGDLVALARFEHVNIKLSALGFMSREPYPHRDVLAWVKRVFDSFGAERLMWGTDTPMSQDPAAIPDAMRLIGLALPEASPEEQAEMMGGTAARLFGWV